MIQENKADTFVEAEHSIGVDQEQQVEDIKNGFNSFIDEYMLLYGRVMEMETDEELSFSEPGAWSKAKDLFRSTDQRVYTGFQRIHEFVLKAESVSGVDKARIAEALLFSGRGEDRSNLFETVAEEIGVDQASPDSVKEVEGEKEQ